MKSEYRKSSDSAPFHPVYESRRWQSVRLSVFLCDDLFCVSFSWASLIYHCVSSGLSPSVLCLNQIFLFFFSFLQRIAFSEEAACTYLETKRTPLAAWITHYGLFIFSLLSKCWCFLLYCSPEMIWDLGLGVFCAVIVCLWTDSEISAQNSQLALGILWKRV